MTEEPDPLKRPKYVIPDDPIVGRLAGGVAHYFNNMLAVILGHTELVLDELDKTENICADLKQIQRAAERLADMIGKLLTCACKQLITRRVLDLNRTIETWLKDLRKNNDSRINFEWFPGIGLWAVKADPSQFNLILDNLYDNAREAIVGVGKIAIETGNKTIDNEYCLEHTNYLSGEYVWLIVNDNGCGMDQETLDHLFEPFFTTKEVGEETGLGLAIVYGAIRQNKGFVNVFSAQGKGTTITIYLPRYTENYNEI